MVLEGVRLRQWLLRIGVEPLELPRLRGEVQRRSQSAVALLRIVLPNIEPLRPLLVPDEGFPTPSLVASRYPTSAEETRTPPSPPRDMHRAHQAG